jgi:IclR family acetate operon transcriptional repressor
MATNQSAQRALAVLEYLADTGSASLGAIAQSLGLNKSTAHRFVGTLVEAGYARQDPLDRTYSLTTRVVEVGSKVMQRLEIHRVLRPVLDDLARVAGETVHLGILDGHDLVYIDKVEGNASVHMASRVGARGTCHSTALGKVLLASRAEAEWQRYCEHPGLTRRTPRTITSPDELFAELRRVRRVGWAIDDVENEEGIRCVAGPVRNHLGQVVGAVSLSGWTVSMTKQRAHELVPVLLEHTNRASAVLGYRRADNGSA